jgi:hypothetical protein
MSAENKFTENRSTQITVEFKGHANNFDVKREPGGILRFRTPQSISPAVVDVEVPSNTFQHTITLQSSALYFADLYCLTKSELDGVELTCRHRVGSCSFTAAEMDKGEWIPLRTLSQDSDFAVKAYIRVQYTVQATASQAAVSTARSVKASVTQLTKHALECCMASNKQFRKPSEWLQVKNSFRLNSGNVSYVDVPLAPDESGETIFHIPDWVLHFHLCSPVIDSHDKVLRYLVHAVRQTCRLHSLTTWDFTDKARGDTNLAAEILGATLGFWPHSIVYLHDKVDSKVATVDVDDYGIPRTMPRNFEAGDDCESVAMEVIRSWFELYSFQPTENERKSDNPDLQAVLLLADLVKKYVYFQATGGLLMGDREIECHSWTVFVPRDMLRLAATASSATTERKTGKLDSRQSTCKESDSKESSNRQKTAGRSTGGGIPLPIINVEATESISCTPYYFSPAQEKLQAKFCQDFESCPSNPAFRYKVPRTVTDRQNRHQFITSLVSCQLFLEDETRACEFVPQSDATGKKGITFAEFQSGQFSLSPIYHLQEQDVGMAKQIIDWLPALSCFTVPQQEVASTDDSVADEKQAAAVHVRIRKSDWSDKRKPFKTDFEAWLKRSDFRLLGKEFEWTVADDLTVVEVVLVQK